MPSGGWANFTAVELYLARRWFVGHAGPTDIARRLGRDKSTATRHAVKKVARKKQGRPAALTEAQVDRLEMTLDKMTRARMAEGVVTASMLHRSTRTRACTRVIREALARRNIRFRLLREKPVLTAPPTGTRAPAR